MIKYSVVIPMYNSEQTIIKSIESIYNQTRFDLVDEIIIVDDGSIDNSVKIIKDFSTKKGDSLITIICKENGGAASARNVGINATRNNYIALLDSDDSWLPNKIEIQNEILELNGSIRALGTNRIGELSTRGKMITEHIYKLSPLQYCLKNWPCTPSLIFDKTIFNDNVYFNESMSHAEEGIFFLDLSALSGLYYVDEPLVLCGGGKPSFGYSGLSGNLKKMHKGVMSMHREAFEKKYLKFYEYIVVQVLEYLKYLRRIVIVYTRK